MSEFITYVDLTDSREISPKHSEDNKKQKCVGTFFHFQNIFPIASNYVSHILSYSNFTCGYLDNQSKYRKSPTH